MLRLKERVLRLTQMETAIEGGEEEEEEESNWGGEGEKAMRI